MDCVHITKERFDEIVKEAIKTWESVPVPGKVDPISQAMMTLQNMTFGVLIGEIMFKNEGDK